jgi:hypothetical protein
VLTNTFVALNLYTPSAPPFFLGEGGLKQWLSLL